MKTLLTDLNKHNQEMMKSIPFAQRILLLPHCMRPSEKCRAKFKKDGLECLTDCHNNCQISALRKLAGQCSYKGVCVAAGGSMALKYIKQNEPQGIVAVACDKELEEGVCAVEQYYQEDDSATPPVIISIPLASTGCLDTRVDLDLAEEIIKT
jgi:hypothetical protein